MAKKRKCEWPGNLRPGSRISWRNIKGRVAYRSEILEVNVPKGCIPMVLFETIPYGALVDYTIGNYRRLTKDFAILLVPLDDIIKGSN